MKEYKEGCSVIVPVFNEAPNLRYILDFLRNYDPANEVIIVNDGSTDGSDEKIQEFLETGDTSKFSFINYPDNQGKAHAVQQGVNAAQFDKIIFSDSDITRIDDLGFDILLRNLSEKFRMIVLDTSYFRRYLFSIGGITVLTSGQRAFYTKDLQQIDMDSVLNYQLEAFLNKWYLDHGYSIKAPFYLGAESPLHPQKKGSFIEGMKHYYKFFSQIFDLVPLHELIYQRAFIPVEGIEWAFFMDANPKTKKLLVPFTLFINLLFSMYLIVRSNYYYRIQRPDIEG